MQRTFLLLTLFSAIGISSLSSSSFHQVQASETETLPLRAERTVQQGMVRQAGTPEMRQVREENVENAEYKMEQRQEMMGEGGAQGEMRQEVMEKRQVMDRRNPDASDEAMRMRSEQKREIAAKHANRLQNRFLNIYSVRLGALFTKIDSRLELMAAEGKDVTDAQYKLNEAQSTMESATETAEIATSAFASLDPDAENAQESIDEAKSLANSAREQYKESLELAKEAVQLAKNEN